MRGLNCVCFAFLSVLVSCSGMDRPNPTLQNEKDLRIVTYGDPLLRVKCKEVKMGDSSAAALLEKMMAVLHTEDKGVGLAAPQVGVLRRLVVIDLQEGPASIYKMINPVITWKSAVLQKFPEGCISIPGVYATVERPDSVSIEYWDENFNLHRIDRATGLLAVCLQHELDHLDGILFVDHLSVKEKEKLLKESEAFIRAQSQKK